MSTSTMYRVRTVLNGWQGAPGLSTCYFSTGGSANAPDALAAVNRVRGAWDVVKSVLSNVTTAQTSGAVDIIDPVDGTLFSGFTVATPALVTGTGGAGTGPAQVAGGLILDTGVVVRGRRLRGRIFVAPLSAAQTGAVLPPTGLGTALDAFGVALLTVTPPAAPPICVWSRPIFDPSTHVLLTPGQQQNATSAFHAVKFYSIRSRRD